MYTFGDFEMTEKSKQTAQISVRLDDTLARTIEDTAAESAGPRAA
jgi:hypothetical protein